MSLSQGINFHSLEPTINIVGNFNWRVMKNFEEEKTEKDSLDDSNEETIKNMEEADQLILMRMKKRRDENEALTKLLNNLNTPHKKKKER